jgi:hypothetical protein
MVLSTSSPTHGTLVGIIERPHGPCDSTSVPGNPGRDSRGTCPSVSITAITLLLPSRVNPGGCNAGSAREHPLPSRHWPGGWTLEQALGWSTLTLEHPLPSRHWPGGWTLELALGWSTSTREYPLSNPALARRVDTNTRPTVEHAVHHTANSPNSRYHHHHPDNPQGLNLDGDILENKLLIPIRPRTTLSQRHLVAMSRKKK